MKNITPGEGVALRNKYLSALTAFLLFFGSAFGQTQTITYTRMDAAGYQYKYGKFDSGINIPNRDTTTGRGTRRGGSMVFDSLHRVFYGWDGIRWSALGSGSSSGQFVDSITVNGANVCQWKQGVPTCYVINTGGGTFTGIDSLTYIGNSICWWKAGVPTCYSLIPGVDSVTVIDSLLCQWVNGNPSCFTITGDVLGSGIDSVTVVGNQLCQWDSGVSICYTINNTAAGIDSVTVVDTTMCTWSGGVSSCFPWGTHTRVYVADDLTVDSTRNPGYQTLGRLHDDGFVFRGAVTKSDCWKVDVGPQDYYKNHVHYLVGQSLGLAIDTADATNPRYDIIVVDTFGVISVITGTPSATPIVPSYNLNSQLVVSTIYIPAGATCLDIMVKMIYDENLGTAGGEFDPTTSGTVTVDFNNTLNPYHLTKAAYVQSHADGASLIFTDNVVDSVINGMILKGAVYINGLQSLTQWLKAQFFLSGVAVSDQQFISTADGLNSLDSTQYQVFGKNVSDFQFPGGKYFDEIRFTMAGDDLSGARGFYIDWVQLQWGLPTATKSYVDSTKIITGNEYYYKNGVPYLAGSVGSGGGGSETLQQVFDVETGHALLTKADTIDVSTHTLRVDGTTGQYNSLFSNGTIGTGVSYTNSQFIASTQDNTGLSLVASLKTSADHAEVSAGQGATQMKLIGSKDSIKISNNSLDIFVAKENAGGQVRFPQYGQGTFFMDNVGLAGFDNNGNLVETLVTPLSVATNSVLNANQTYLNLVQGSNMTITDDGAGNITFDAAGGGGGGTVTNIATGNGLTGGPITTTGTIKADTSTTITGLTTLYQNSLNNLLTVTGRDSLTTHNMIAGDTARNFTTIRDSIYQKKNFTTTTTGIKGAMLWSARTEKYNTTGYDTHGKMGDWNSWLTRNYYNVSRPGEILYPYTYNMNNAGGAILTDEGAYGKALESDYNRGFESYEQVIMSNGTAYRPYMIVAKKDTIPGSEFAIRTPIFHIMYPDSAADYFNAKNGEMSVYNVRNRPSALTAGTAIFRLQGDRPMNLLNNGGSLLFGGAASYLFDSAVSPVSHNVIDLGAQASRWRKGFIQGLQTSFTVVPDANYTVLITDHSLSFKNITANRTLTLPTSFTGNTFITGTQLNINTGQNTYKVTYSGATVKNPDGTTATELAAGQSCIMEFDGSNWQITSTTAATVAGVTPIANGGTNNGSLSVTAGTVYYGDGSKLVGLAPGTSNQILHGGTTPSWKDTTAVTGGGGGTPAGNYGNVQINRNGAFDVAASDSLDYESASGLTLKNIFTSSKTGATAATVYDGFTGNNSTTSSLSNPMYGPAWHSIGHAWKSNATATDQSVDMRVYNLTAQGATAAIGNFYVDFSIAGGAYANAFRVASDGTLITAGPIFGTSGGFTSTLSLTKTSTAQTFQQGLNIQATTAATSGVPIQYSPTLLFTGRAWDGSADKAADYRFYVKPTNGTSPITSQFILQSQVGGAGYSDIYSISDLGKMIHPATNTATGTTGNQTINKPSGTVNIAASGTSVTVTNSLCTTSSIVFAVLRTNDATATIKNVVPGSGSFVITLGAAATAEVSIGFFVIN